MDMIKAFLSIVLISAVISCSTAASDDFIVGLRSPKANERESALRWLSSLENSDDRLGAVTSLRSLLRENNLGDNYRGTAHLALVALGELQLPQGVSSLLDWLNFIPNGFQSEEMLRYELYYPAVRSLIKIGVPIKDPVLAYFATHRYGCEKRKLALFALKEVFGGEAVEVFVRELYLTQRALDGFSEEQGRFLNYLSAKPSFRFPKSFRLPESFTMKPGTDFDPCS